MISAPLVTLRHGPHEAVLAPAGGGCVNAYRFEGFDVLRAGTGDLRDPGSQACFPLVPYSGRIDHGRFRFQGRDYQLPPNFPYEPHTLHGDGWQGSWTVADQDAGSVSMVFHHEYAGLALCYRAWQRFALDDAGLSMEIGLRNTGDRPMPAGIGQHPYFERRPGTLLSAAVEAVWLPAAPDVPRDTAPVPAAIGFGDRRLVTELVLDHGFAGFGGTASIAWPNEGYGVVIEAEPVFGQLVVYVPPGEDFFCVEPVSNVANGFNLLAEGRADTGVVVLGPGEELAGTIRLRPNRLRP